MVDSETLNLDAGCLATLIALAFKLRHGGPQRLQYPVVKEYSSNHIGSFKGSIGFRV